MVKNPPAVWETWVWSVCWEDPLEKGMTTHLSSLTWRIPWTEEPGRRYSPRGHKELDMTEWLSLPFCVVVNKIKDGSILLFSHWAVSNFATPWTVALQAPLSVDFPRQEYWSGLSLPSLVRFPNARIRLVSAALSDGFLTTELPGKLLGVIFVTRILF